jgi:SAM-dependent methyltransferase
MIPPRTTAGGAQISLQAVQVLLARHVPLYRTRTPIYQTELLRSLAALWDPGHVRVLDIGGGTGLIAQAMKDLFGIPHVTSVDVENRFLTSLTIETAVYDGVTLPYPDASFDSIVLSNVLHHVPTPARTGLLSECARVAGHGPVYVKDHLASSYLDHARLAALDLMGNLPFAGMVRAYYPGPGDWELLAAGMGYRIDRQIGGNYRSGCFERLFPNRLEVTLRMVAVPASAPSGVPARGPSTATRARLTPGVPAAVGNQGLPAASATGGRGRARERSADRTP